MAGNYILLPYKVFDALSNGCFSEEESWRFIIALVNYDRSEVPPVFSLGKESSLWTIIKPELNCNKSKYLAEVERRSKAGKKGGSSTSEKKVVAARKNGHLGGAPLGNKNAVKTTQTDNENNNENENDNKNMNENLNKNNNDSFGGNT